MQDAWVCCSSKMNLSSIAFEHVMKNYVHLDGENSVVSSYFPNIFIHQVLFSSQSFISLFSFEILLELGPDYAFVNGKAIGVLFIGVKQIFFVFIGRKFFLVQWIIGFRVVILFVHSFFLFRLLFFFLLSPFFGLFFGLLLSSFLHWSWIVNMYSKMIINFELQFIKMPNYKGNWLK